MLIDFDANFQKYLRSWLKQNKDKFKNVDEMESAVPDVYLAWLNTPSALADGKSPRAYFAEMGSATVLVDTFIQYCQDQIGVPEALLDALVSADGAEDALMPLLTTDQGLAGDGQARKIAINLLGELQSIKPMQLYVDWVCKAEDEDEWATHAADQLCNMDERVIPPIKKALNEKPSNFGIEIFLDVLRHFPNDEQTLSLMIRMLKEVPQKRALFAGYLGAYGDASALPALQEAISEKNIGYLDYLELRDAIESLGGKPPVRRDFDGDIAYESMKHLQHETGEEDK